MEQTYLRKRLVYSLHLRMT